MPTGTTSGRLISSRKTADRGLPLSFRLKIILGVALIETLLLILLIVSALDFLRTSNEKQLTQRAELTSQLLAHIAKEAVISSDLAALHELAQEISEDTDITYFRIATPDHVLAEAGLPGALSQIQSKMPPPTLKENLSDGIYDVQQRITEGGQAFGTLYMGLSVSSFQGVMSSAQRWIIGIATIEVLLVAVFSLILGGYLSRQLHAVIEAFEAIYRSGPGEQILVKGNDDLAELSNAFNKMSTRLMESESQLKAALRLAKAGEAKHQAMLSASLDAIVTINRQGKIMHCNDAVTDITGWPPQELLNKPVTRALLPEFTDHLHELASLRTLPQRSRETGLRLNSHAIAWDGTHIPVEMAISSIPAESGQLIVVYLRDITERREHETELRLAAHAFESTEAIFITDAQGTIMRVNQAFTQITGYSPQEVIGEDPGILASGKDNNTFFQLMRTTLREQGRWQGEVYNRRKNGEIYPEHLNITAVKDGEGYITHYVAHSVDISQQKDNERNLSQARIEAEQANAAKSRFLATMSHEIRTPLNGVMGILGILKSTNITDEQQKYLATAYHSAEHLLSVINDILDYSKMEAGKLKLESTQFELQPLLEQVHDMMLPLAAAKHLSISTEIASATPVYLNADPERLRQVLLNLVNNAIKFTPTGGLHIHVSIEHTIARFAVIDTGIGISEEHIGLLFDEFSMIDQTTSRQQEGSGLGLAICKRLVTLMGGHIGVTSQPGQGSQFWFTLPEVVTSTPLTHAQTDTHRIDTPSTEPIETPATINLQDSAAPEEASVGSATESPQSPTGQSKPHAPLNAAPEFEPGYRILLAEDNPANQLVIKTLLVKAGLYVDIAGNGAEAIETVGKHPYDLVLMDISMPIVDGLQATATIRAMAPPLCHIPIIAITAHALSGDRERFMDSGMDDYLTKPVDKLNMLICIDKWLKKRPDADTKSTDHLNQTCADSETTSKEPDSNMANPDIDNAPIIDFGILDQLAEDTSPDLVPELIELYSGDAAGRIERITQALTQNDTDTISFEVHTIGSSAAAHGNTRLYKLSREIERLCQEEEYDAALQLTQGFPALANESIRQLVEHRKTLI